MKSLHGKVYGGAIILLAGAVSALAQSQPPEFATNWSNLNDLARFHVEETEYLLKSGALDAASLELQQALSLVPDHPTLLRWAADLYTDRGQYAMAESYWAQLSEVFPSNAWVFYRWGEVLFEMNQFDRAEKSLSRALEIEPGDLPARYHLACIYLANGDRSQAEPLLQKLSLTEIIELAARIREESESLPGKIGHKPFGVLCRLVLGDTTDGAAETDLEPSSETASWAERMRCIAEELPKARAALEAQQWAEALPHLEAVMAAGLQAPEVLRDRALTLYHLGEKAQALDELARLVQDYPDLPGLQQTYGQLLLEERRFTEAAKALDAARQQDPADVQAGFALICAYAAKGRYTDARDTARALSPGQAAQISAWLKEGHSYREYLKDNSELLEWLLSLGDPEAAEEPAGD